MNKGMLLKAAGGAAAAGALAAAVPALAASSSSTSTSAASQTARPHLRHNGFGSSANGETALTGATLTSASNAAVAAVPGGKVSRASTETDGTVSRAAYEVHVTKSNGSQVVVIEDASFKVLSVQAGAGGHGHCPGGPDGSGARGAADYGPPQGAQFQSGMRPGGPPQGGPNI